MSTDRRRNARGEGARLGEEIVAGALAIVDRGGGPGAITLRAVARQIGIAAPSIYAHFATRDEIVLAVVERVFGELAAAIREGIAEQADPELRLVAGCSAYVSFGLANPDRYAMLFAGLAPPAGHQPDRDPLPPPSPRSDVMLSAGGEAFGLLTTAISECVAAGRSASEDVFADATATWVALHGTVSLRTAVPGFPWPEPGDFVRDLVRSLARIRGG